MADVAGAFKVLIEANPSQANAAFQQILDSANKAGKGTDTWASAITGLNQGIELTKTVIGGAVSGIKLFADTMLSASSAALDFVAKGGDFNEQFKQFSIFANSFGQSGDKIISTFKEVSQGTITTVDSMRIATKALAAGIVGGDLETVLTYAKKWSESTGQAFEDVAETMIESFQKGTTKSLKTIGLMVDAGATYGDVMKTITEKNKQFGDTGVNLADILKSMSIGFDEFKTQIAGAIADSPTLTNGIQNLSNSFSSLIERITSPSALGAFTKFFDIIFQSIELLLPSFEDVFSGIESLFDSFFSLTIGQVRLEIGSVLTTFAEVFQEIATIGVSVFNTLMDAASWLGAGITKPLALLGTAFGIIFDGIVDGILFLGNTFYDTLKYMANTATTILAKFPKLAEALGLDKFAGSQTALLAEEQALFQGMGDSAKAFTSTFAAGLMGADFRREKFFEGMKLSVPDFVGQAAKATKAIQGIKPGAMTDWDNLTSGVQRATKHINVFGKETAPKAMKSASSAIKKEGDGITKTFEGVTKAIGDSFKSFSDIFNSAAGAAGGFGKELSAAFSELAGLESNALISQMDKWDAGDVLKDKIRTMMDAMRDQVTFQNRALNAAEAQAEAQRMLAAALLAAQRSGILHRITVENFAEFMDHFIVDVFKRAGVEARAEGVRIAGA